MSPPSSSSSSLSNPKMAELDLPLSRFGFEIEELSAEKVSGRLKVTELCCQPFKVLHGGVSALIAEALASMGAHLASGLQRVAGIHLAINHIKAAQLGDVIIAQATPITVGKTIQVWEVQLKKLDSSNSGNSVLISSSRVTLLSNMPVPENAKTAAENIRKYAKL
ncbi:1-4-dihydroxy-2-naphthoyl-CoA thioesterase 1 [Ranunculus cassubicifolius]